MTTPTRLVILIALLLAVLVPRPAAVLAQDDDGRRYFPETGHWVTNNFLAKYESVPNPELVFGFPLTDAYEDPTTRVLIQYFQRARFEFHPDKPPEVAVQLTPLGQYLYEPGAELTTLSNATACRTYSETGYQVCYTFLEFFNENGGVALFGYPISNFEIHDGRIMQYFQRARFEWMPERPAGERVRISSLGSLYFEVRKENPARKDPVPGDNILQSILSLQVRAFPAKAVTPFDGSQTIYIIVQDQNLLPVPDATITLEITPPVGETQRLIVTDETDKNGMTQLSFKFNSQAAGITKISVTASYNKLQAKTVTSFRIWY